MALRGSYGEDSYADETIARDSDEKKERVTCVSKHYAKKLECGHKGCNFHDGCYTCKVNETNDREQSKIEKDKLLVQEMMGRTSSNLLKKCLSEFTDDSRTKRKKRECS
jgi:hypothetical protein